MRLSSYWRQLLLPIAWVVGALWMAQAAVIPGALDPSRRHYGANWPGDLPRLLFLASIEVALLYAILRPATFRASWGRALWAVMLLVPYTAITTVVAMHGGPIIGAHLLWLTGLTLAMCVVLVVAAASAIARWRAPAT